ncbi:lipoprotein insertase outer membrane protein LolB [Bowmanella denitrificans]|uniref:lipoprotein insertase outer membrane protein LolB n=1 Tax=Bowmanella denitrificans TaxID=366582 RepID=UPI0031D92FB2
MFRSFFCLLGACLLLSLLSACTTRPDVTYSVDAKANQIKLQNLHSWRINGKLAYQGKEERFSATLNWQQSPDEYELGLSSFIGTRILTLHKNGALVTLEYEDKDYQHQNASELLYELTGWPIPVEQIPLWIKGQVSPDTRPLFSDNGLLQQLNTAQGWQVNMSDYRPTGAYILPYNLELKTPTELIRIRVNTWQIN